MKVSIITITDPINYGAVLQSFALYRFIFTLGCQVEVIDFKPRYRPTNMIQSLKHRAQSLLLNERKKKSIKFKSSYMNFTDKSYKCFEELKDNPPLADMYIVGSDQVWNSDISNGLEPSYFLDFVPKGKKISYASSIGRPSVPILELKDMKNYLEKFDAISVRESSAKKLLEEVGLSNIHHVLDPVFLLERLEYLKLSLPTKLKKYLLIYGFEPNEVLNEIAHKIANERGLQIVELGGATKKHKSDNFISNIGPQEFIGLIDGADYILTSSFHGTAFSIIFNKNFICVPPSQRGTRVESIINALNLQQRSIKTIDEFNIETVLEPLDYENVNKLLECEINKSKQFLINEIS